MPSNVNRRTQDPRDPNGAAPETERAAGQPGRFRSDEPNPQPERLHVRTGLEDEFDEDDFDDTDSER